MSSGTGPKGRQFMLIRSKTQLIAGEPSARTKEQNSSSTTGMGRSRIQTAMAMILAHPKIRNKLAKSLGESAPYVLKMITIKKTGETECP